MIVLVENQCPHRFLRKKLKLLLFIILYLLCFVASGIDREKLKTVSQIDFVRLFRSCGRKRDGETLKG